MAGSAKTGDQDNDKVGSGLTGVLAGSFGDAQTKGVELHLHQQGLDTSTSAGRSWFPFCLRQSL